MHSCANRCIPIRIKNISKNISSKKSAYLQNSFIMCYIDKYKFQTFFVSFFCGAQEWSFEKGGIMIENERVS